MDTTRGRLGVVEAWSCVCYVCGGLELFPQALCLSRQPRHPQRSGRGQGLIHP